MKFNSNPLVALFLLLFINVFIVNASPVNIIQIEKRNFITDAAKKVKNTVEKFVTSIIHTGNRAAVTFGIDTAKFGSKVLDMKKDENGIYHADFNCWQKYFGYNKFYDFMFDIGTSMDYNNEGMFTYNGENYILWAWKGDYVNLGAGAELGIYKGGKTRNSHWSASPEDAMPMTLTLTHNTEGTIVNHWTNNGEDSWWITAFNPNYRNVNAADLTATFTVEFKDLDMFKAFEETQSSGWTYDNATHTATLVL